MSSEEEEDWYQRHWLILLDTLYNNCPVLLAAHLLYPVGWLLSLPKTFCLLSLIWEKWEREDTRPLRVLINTVENREGERKNGCKVRRGWRLVAASEWVLHLPSLVLLLLLLLLPKSLCFSHIDDDDYCRRTVCNTHSVQRSFACFLCLRCVSVCGQASTARGPVPSLLFFSYDLCCFHCPTDWLIAVD